MNATPGVVIIPALSQTAPTAPAPEKKASEIHGPDSLVSRPITTRGLRPSCSAILVASECPILVIVARSKGYSPATPRTPSVPNNFSITKNELIVIQYRNYKDKTRSIKII